ACTTPQLGPQNEYLQAHWQACLSLGFYPQVTCAVLSCFFLSKLSPIVYLALTQPLTIGIPIDIIFFYPIDVH
ncbi:TPA: hypothetical protein ACIFBD_004506, partial [Escherichia coli]